jgi:hypothetical protein
MNISSIDDIVEQGIRDVPVAMGHLAHRIGSCRSLAAPHLRRAFVIIALVTVSFLFRPQFIVALAVTFLVLGVVPFWIKRMIRERSAGTLLTPPS